ncbi:MAG: hypothetical protein AAFN81_21675 [Bacteroidota bacterium]
MSSSGETFIQIIHSSIEKGEEEVKDYESDTTDVIVELQNGDLLVASFLPYKNVSISIERNRISGDYLSGKYFWVDRMVLVEKCDPSTIEEVVHNLLEEGDFFKVFQKI